MKFYFSGISSKEDYAMLQEAGVDLILVDQFDLSNVNGFPGKIALDSGAYWAWKNKKELSTRSYIELAKSKRFDFRVMIDVIGDPFQTHQRWVETFKKERIFMPVWHWGSPASYLTEYLSEAPIVGIGGLVPLMRDKDMKMLEQLKSICTLYPNRFHIFGINWLRAIEELKGLIYSGDSSKHLDGGRYGHVIFRNTRTGHLSQAPQKVLGLNLSRRERIVECAKNIKAFVEG